MASLWILTTLIAAAAQTVRNTVQRNLTGPLGTVGATQVRFLFGFPFSILFLAVMLAVTGWTVPAQSLTSFAFTFAGALSQIMATALMLAAMRDRAFSVTIAYTKTEPVQVAIFGIVALGDHLSLSAALAIPIATIGVLLMAIKPGDRFGVETVKPALLGIASGTFFALSAVGFRGGILALGDGPALLRATTTLVWSLGIQSAVLFVWLAIFNRPALLKSLALWRASSGAGFMGALASQFWFIGFSLTSAANVRTLGLVEVIFAQFVTRRVFSEGVAKRELVGITLVVIGVGSLLLPALLP